MQRDWQDVTTVARMLELRAAQTPQAAAFRQESSPGQWRSISWGEFAERVATLRRGLFEAGLRRGDRLALIAPVSLQWELLHHAALSMGVIVVGLDAHDLPERIATMVDQADVQAFALVDIRPLARLKADRLRATRFALMLRSDPGAAPVQSAHDVHMLTWQALESLGGASTATPEPPTGEDIATILFTSGTTGAPKGIAYRHRQLCLAVAAIGEAFDFIGPESQLLCWLPLSNLFQRVVNLAGVRNGPVSYLLADPRRVMDVVADVSPDVFIGVPRFYEKLYDAVRSNIAAQPRLQRRLAEWAWQIGRQASRRQRAGRALPPWLALAHAAADRLVLRRVRSAMGLRLRCMVTGSAPTSVHLLEEFHALGWLVLEAYGLSENALPIAMNRIDDFRFGTVGKPMPGNEVVVAGDGAIKVRGPGLFAGYLGESDRPTFDDQGFYLTGDLGRFDSEGYLRLTGRSGDMIKTSTGRRVAPAAVEARLCSVSGVEQALVLGNGRKCLIALCTVNGADLNPAARGVLEQTLRDQVRQINEHERPQGIALIDRPFSIERGELTPNLKLRRAAIEEQHAALIDHLYEQIAAGTKDAARQLFVIRDAEPVA